jgi:hypothetical protein
MASDELKAAEVSLQKPNTTSQSDFEQEWPKQRISQRDKEIADLKAIAEIKASRMRVSEGVSERVSIDEILEAPSIAELIKLPPSGFEFDKYKLLYFCRKMLQLEEKRITNANYADEAERGKDKKRIREKLKEIKLHLENESPAPPVENSELQVLDKDNTRQERELTRWFRETWIKEGKPGGAAFFNALKKYVLQPKSPITQHYTSSKDGPGIRWNTGRATNDMTKKAIQNKVSKFKKEQR